MENRAFGALGAALLLCCGYAAPVMSEPLRVLYAEPFQAQSTSTRGVQKAGPANLRVQAFGRTFELELVDNSRLLRATSAQTRERIGSIQLLKGTIKDVPGSWVRLTLSDGRYSGAFWDGAELYAIALRETLETALLAPMRPATTAIYRLSDTQGGLLAGTCGVDGGKRASSSPLEKFKALIHELRAAADSSFAAAPREIQVAMLADFELTSRHGSGTANRLLERANIVDGIFSSQVGVSTIPTDFVTFATQTDPFTSSEPSSLLTELGNYRSSTPAIRSRGLAHLVTGRQLAGDVIGMAFLGSLCEAHAGSSLSESSDFIDSALIMAHELGHNFGAPHDSEAGSPCEAEPLGFMMAPELNGSTTFSACSVQQMQPHIAAASCVATSLNRDVAVSIPMANLETIVNEPFEVAIDLLSLGTADAANVVLTVNFTNGTEVSSATMPGADCALDSHPFSPALHCTMPIFAAGASSRLTVRAVKTTSGGVGFGIQVLSSGDVNSNNDRGHIQVEVWEQRALRVTPISVPDIVTLGEQYEAELEIAAVGNQTLTDLVADLFLEDTRLIAHSIDGGSTCDPTSVGERNLQCMISSLTPGTPRRLRLQLIGDRIQGSGGTLSVRERSAVTGASGSFGVHIRPARDIEVWTDEENRIAAVGTDAVWPIEVRSVGAFAMDDVQVRVGLWEGADASLSGPLAALCTRTSSEHLDCDLGTMAAGAVIAGQLRARADEPASLWFSVGVTPVLSDDDFMNDFIQLGLRAGFATDTAVTGPATMSLFDRQPASFQATVSALGTGPSEDLFVRASFRSQFTITAARLGQTPCTISSSTARCTHVSLPSGQSLPLTIDYQVEEPGTYVGEIHVSSTQDFVSSNDGHAITFLVAPGVNSSLQAPGPAVLPAGETREVVYTVRTNRYALIDARLDFSWFGVLDEFVATAPGATCSPSASGHRCNFPMIVANSAIPVRVRIRSPGATVASINAVLASPAETSPQDNAAFVSYTFLERGDLTLSTTQPSPNAVNGQRAQVTFNLDVLSAVLDGFLEIGFDPARVEAPTTLIGSPCTWNTQPVRCVLGSTRAAGSYVENFSFIPRGTGSLQLALRVGGRNDFNTANDQLTITVNVGNPAPTPPTPPPSSGGGGGGGSMSWLLAALLLVMWHHRRLRAHR